MPIIVEDGTGLLDADSYVSLADAEAYISVMPASASTAWVALTTDAMKEALLVYATRVLDQKTYWHGHKAVPSSALRWPRTQVNDADGLPISDSVVPQRVKDAVCEMAVWFAVPGQNPFTISSNQGIESLTVDVIKIVYKSGFDAGALAQLPPGLNAILFNLGNVRYSGRSSFGIISKA